MLALPIFEIAVRFGVYFANATRKAVSSYPTPAGILARILFANENRVLIDVCDRPLVDKFELVRHLRENVGGVAQCVPWVEIRSERFGKIRRYLGKVGGELIPMCHGIDATGAT